jgi:hypothetical protein
VEREPGRSLIGGVNDSALSLASEWRKLGRLATIVAVLTAPALYVVCHNSFGWSVFWSIVAALAGIIIFRGFIDVVAHKLIPFPPLYGAEESLRAQDVILVLEDAPAPLVLAAADLRRPALDRRRRQQEPDRRRLGQRRPQQDGRLGGRRRTADRLLRPDPDRLLLHQPGDPLRPAVLLLDPADQGL